MYFWRGNWIHSRFLQKLPIFSGGALAREGKGRKGAVIVLAGGSRSSSAWNFQHLQAGPGLGRMLSTTAEITTPAALAPSMRTCSTCRAEGFTLRGLCPALPLRLTPPLQEPGCRGSLFLEEEATWLAYISKDSREVRMARDGQPRQMLSLSPTGIHGSWPPSSLGVHSAQGLPPV